MKSTDVGPWHRHIWRHRDCGDVSFVASRLWILTSYTEKAWQPGKTQFFVKTCKKPWDMLKKDTPPYLQWLLQHSAGCFLASRQQASADVEQSLASTGHHGYGTIPVYRMAQREWTWNNKQEQSFRFAQKKKIIQLWSSQTINANIMPKTKKQILSQSPRGHSSWVEYYYPLTDGKKINICNVKTSINLEDFLFLRFNLKI